MKLFTKSEYINGLNHDLQYCNEAIAAAKTLTWWHGEKLTQFRLKLMKKEFESEIEKIKTDKNYRPWNENF